MIRKILLEPAPVTLPANAATMHRNGKVVGYAVKNGHAILARLSDNGYYGFVYTTQAANGPVFSFKSAEEAIASACTNARSVVVCDTLAELASLTVTPPTQ